MIKKIIFFILFYNITYSQSFIILDDETLEFVENVNFNLFFNKKKIYESTCNNEGQSTLPKHIVFDSISFQAFNYNTLGLKKESISQSILLSKKIITLDEIVVSSNNLKEITLGEKNRFVKRYSSSFSKNPKYGSVFHNQTSTDLYLKKVVFFVEKVKYKTAYKINFYKFKQSPIEIGHQKKIINELIFTSDTLFLEPTQKNQISTVLTQNYKLEKNESIFVDIQLINYYDINENIIHPNIDDETRLKFQLSNKANYYSKMVNHSTGEYTLDYVNINAMINYDFANRFFKKPHKSNLVTPAIVLHTTINQ